MYMCVKKFTSNYSFQAVTEVNHRSPEYHVSGGKKISDSEAPDIGYAVPSANAIVQDFVSRYQDT